MKLNVAKVIKDLGGATKIIEDLKRAGVDDISIKAIEKWRERGTIPMKRWIQLRKIAKGMKKNLELEDYLMNANKTANHKGK